MPVLANFHAELIYDSHDPTRVEDCQVTLEEQELRFAGTDYESRIDLQSVFDVKLGQPPMSVADRFTGKTLTIAVEREQPFGERGRDIYFLSNEDESSIEHFGQILYRSVLNGTEVAVRHPVQIGGRRTNSAFTIGEPTSATATSVSPGSTCRSRSISKRSSISPGTHETSSGRNARSSRSST